MSMLIKGICALVGVVYLVPACGGQEQPPPEQPSGYQAPTADAGTDEGIGNMGSDPGDDEPGVAPTGTGMSGLPQSMDGYQQGTTVTGNTSRGISSTTTGAGGGPVAVPTTRGATGSTTGMSTGTGGTRGTL